MPRRLFFASALAALAACGPAAAPQPATGPAEIAVAPAPAAPAPEPEEAHEKSPAPPKAPPGYVEVSVVGVTPTSNGGAAVLVGPLDKRRVVPIYIGGTEGVSITMRVNEERPERPLTHDLLDSVMRELGGKLVKVQVDELRGGVFIGSIFVRQEGRQIEIDSRASDAIALAVGNKVPIFMAKEVLEQAGEENPEPPGP